LNRTPSSSRPASSPPFPGEESSLNAFVLRQNYLKRYIFNDIDIDIVHPGFSHPYAPLPNPTPAGRKTEAGGLKSAFKCSRGEEGQKGGVLLP
jgi:hypothetical protein